MNQTADPGLSSSCVRFGLCFYTLFIGCVCVLGLVGNTLSLLVLRRDRSHRVALFLLQALAVADNLVLLIAFFVLSVFQGLAPVFLGAQMAMTWSSYLRLYLEPWAHMSYTATIWLTVLLAVNRYVAVCTPLKSLWLCTVNKTRVQVCGVFLFSLVFNTPRFFQLRLKRIHDSSNISYVDTEPTAIGANTTFHFLYNEIACSLIIVFIPIVILIVLNTRLIVEIKRMRVRRTSLTLRSPMKGDTVTPIMVAIIVVAIICHIPDRAFEHARHLFIEENAVTTVPCGSVTYYIQAITNLLIIINSSINFLFFYILRSSFRRILKMQMCRPTKGDIPLASEHSRIRPRSQQEVRYMEPEVMDMMHLHRVTL